MSAGGKRSPVKFGTQSLIKLKDGKPKPVRQFDASYSDVPSQVSMATDTTDGSQLTDSGWNGHTENGNSSLVPNSVPSHLLMVSILEQLCLMYTKDNNKSKKLFKVICEQLVKHHVVTPLTILDEMSSLRNQYRSFMDSVLKAGMVKVSASVPTHQLDMELDLAEPRVPRHENFLITSEAIRQMQTSRYRAEFTELKKIGSGGFGSVYMAKHNLDGRKYAIKKITFKHSQPEVWMKVLREVKALANVQHPNVVGYNAAWLEYATCPGRGRCRNAHRSGDNISTPVDVSLPSQVSVTDDSVVFAEEFTESDLHRNGIQVRETEIHEHRMCVVKELEEFSVKCRACEIMRGDGDKTDSFQSGFVLKIPEHECIQKYHQSETTETYLSSMETESRATGSVCMGESWENTELSTFRDRRLRVKRSLSCDNASPKRSQEKYDEDNCSDQPHPKFHVTLLIQMELCSLTLKDWLQNRNQHCCDQSEFLRYSDKNMKIFKQILKGVDFIHNSGLIHRDLKPRNIFLHEPELHVKIGDFGLAKDDLGKTDQDGIILTPSPDYNGEFKWESHTSGVGTSTYAAPEQLEGSFYSNKSDIYSLGVILHELFSHFKTEMEKFHSLNRLRQERKVDQDFEISWPIQAKFVKKMSSPEPHERPTAKTLLSSELFLTKDQIILDMQRKLDQKDTEIEDLKKRLFERDKVISNMRKEYEKVESIKW